MIVLDTHVLLWLIMADDRLGSGARGMIERTLKQTPVYVPPIVFWEISMNVAKGRVALGQLVRQWTASVLSVPNMLLAPFNEAIAIEAGELADGLHGDPADRIIVATARALNHSLVTVDRKILSYAEAGHVQITDARR